MKGKLFFLNIYICITHTKPFEMCVYDDILYIEKTSVKLKFEKVIWHEITSNEIKYHDVQNLSFLLSVGNFNCSL